MGEIIILNKDMNMSIKKGRNLGDDTNKYHYNISCCVLNLGSKPKYLFIDVHELVLCHPFMFGVHLYRFDVYKSKLELSEKIAKNTLSHEKNSNSSRISTIFIYWLICLRVQYII